MSEFLKFPSNFVSDQFVEYIDKSEIQTVVESLAHTISQKYKGQELVLVGLLKGSMIFMSDLARQIKNVKVYIDFMKVEAVGRSKESNGTIVISKDLSSDVLNKNVLIVEEIIDTGRALSFVKERIAQAEPSNIEVITLFDKPYKRAVPVKADYIGKQIEDQFVIGYGLDLDQYGRNMSEIYYLKYPN
ncbi:MAG: hypoxanthine phosphoribosyltransferase [Halobacteriovoraceae bacterium]|nr:hypoxanthine phosphoribosyltransferase [Halobacteriovoraceae bacterium]|tara:strand:+ start:610 stop:1173 length:564 start_codon:yes stop_codon:yes gene_type:complete